MTNPFDLHSTILAHHAQHVVLIHFPIALCLSAVLFDYLAQWKKSDAFAAAAYFNLMLAAISTVPVLLSGLAAWQWALNGQRLKGILLLHLVMGCLSAAFIWMLFYLHRRARLADGKPLLKVRLALEATAVVVIAATAHLGGFLSGVNLA